jgi:hypothetical protein
MTKKELVGVALVTTLFGGLGSFIVYKAAQHFATAADQPILMAGGSLRFKAGDWTLTNPPPSPLPLGYVFVYGYDVTRAIRKVEWSCGDDGAYEAVPASGRQVVVTIVHRGRTTTDEHIVKFFTDSASSQNLKVQVTKDAAGINGVGRLFLEHMFSTGEYPRRIWKAGSMTSEGLVNNQGSPFNIDTTNCGFPDSALPLEQREGFFLLRITFEPAP